MAEVHSALQNPDNPGHPAKSASSQAADHSPENNESHTFHFRFECTLPARIQCIVYEACRHADLTSKFSSRLR